MTEMNTAPQLAPRERCTGCAACCNGCPKGAIRMVPDREGFLYPQVTDGCVQCGHCTHICPVPKQREPRTEPAAFIVWNGLLEYPQYSRPEEWHGRRVPEVLLSGHHGNVADWRTKESYKRTMARRPDMWARFDLTQVHSRHDKKVLAQALEEYAREQGGAPETE